MIHYPKRYWGLPLLFRAFGSPFPRTIPFAILSVALTVALQLAKEWKLVMMQAFGHPYPFQVYAFVIGFLAVFRTNHALARFMEARTEVETMGSKWADCVMMLQAFDGGTTGARTWEPGRRFENHEPSEGTDEFIARIVHLMSLLHALALQQLRGDECLENLVIARHRKGNGVDVNDAKATLRSDDADPIAANVIVVGDDSKSTGGTGAGDVVKIVLSSLAFSKGQSLKTYNLGGAFLQTSAVDDVYHPRGEIISVFSLTEIDEKWRECCAATPLAVIGGLDVSEVSFLQKINCDRAYLVMSWIQTLIVSRTEEKEGLRIPPPILSRVWQVLSEGMTGLNQADKLAKTPFPMPYAQMLTVLLLIFNLTLPVMIAANVNAVWLGIVVAFVTTVAYQGLNETARELEDPFKPTHVNDLGLPQLQAMFNSKIRACTPGAEAQLDFLEQMRVVRTIEHSTMPDGGHAGSSRWRTRRREDETAARPDDGGRGPGRTSDAGAGDRAKAAAAGSAQTRESTPPSSHDESTRDALSGDA
jgi:predicted membrane chloride channel (bestrophin family)